MARRPPRRTQSADEQLSDDDARARARQLRSVANQFEQCRRRHEWGDPFTGAWSAYEAARSNGVDVPEWVLAYFRRVAQRMLAISREKPRGKTLGGAVLRALEITRGGGPSVFSRRDTAYRDAAIAEHVRDLVEAGGMQVKAAIAEVSGERGRMLRWSGERGDRSTPARKCQRLRPSF
jgi:hypothetical protein